jgi:hypothetical protein
MTVSIMLHLPRRPATVDVGLFLMLGSPIPHSDA